MRSYGEVTDLLEDHQLRAGHGLGDVFRMSAIDCFVVISKHDRRRHRYGLQLVVRPIRLARPHGVHLSQKGVIFVMRR